MSETGEWHHDPDHRHQCAEFTTTGRCSGHEDRWCTCMCGARLVMRSEFWVRHECDLWWWWLPDGTYASYPDRRPLPTVTPEDDGDAWQAL